MQQGKDPGIFGILYLIQDGIRKAGKRDFKAFVCWSKSHDANVLRIEVNNPGGPFALLDAAGTMFGEVNIADGCESCGHGSVVTIELPVVQHMLED